MAEVLRHLPQSADPNLLVGYDTRDDAGVYQLPDGRALVQTVDFFTPVVDDPYAFGQIAAANALSDVYAMGGTPLTVLNIACFNPSAAPAETWASVFRGIADKVAESGAVIVGGHSVEDEEPKFGMAVTGLVDPKQVFSNRNAKPGDGIWLTKRLGTGIIATAAKHDACSQETLTEAIREMTTLNASAADLAHSVGCTCATDITGFGLLGHLFNVAEASKVDIHVNADQLPLLPDVQSLAEAGETTGGARKNRLFLGFNLEIVESVPQWLVDVALDPQTSGGLAIFSPTEVPGATWIGEVVAGTGKVRLTS